MDLDRVRLEVGDYYPADRWAPARVHVFVRILNADAKYQVPNEITDGIVYFDPDDQAFIKPDGALSDFLLGIQLGGSAGRALDIKRWIRNQLDNEKARACLAGGDR